MRVAQKEPFLDKPLTFIPSYQLFIASFFKWVETKDHKSFEESFQHKREVIKKKITQEKQKYCNKQTEIWNKL